MQEVTRYHHLRDVSGVGPKHFCSKRRCDDPCSASIEEAAHLILKAPGESPAKLLGINRLLVALAVTTRAFNSLSYAEALKGRAKDMLSLSLELRARFPEEWKRLAIDAAVEVFKMNKNAISVAFEASAPAHNSETTALKGRRLPTPARKSAGLNVVEKIYNDLYEQTVAGLCHGLDGPAALVPLLNTKDGQEMFLDMLVSFKGIGNFRADQCLLDLCEFLGHPVLTLRVGDGTRRGICWLRGWRMTVTKSNDVDWCGELKKVTTAVEAALQKKHQPILGGMGRVAHFMCEVDKWFRDQSSPEELRAWSAQPYSRYRQSAK